MMEKKLNAGAFMKLNSCEAMEVDGGYKFIDDYTPTKSSSSKSSSFGSAVKDTLKSWGMMQNDSKLFSGTGGYWH